MSDWFRPAGSSGDADFDAQIRSVLGRGVEDPATFRAASETVIGVLMRGILPARR